MQRSCALISFARTLALSPDTKRIIEAATRFRASPLQRSALRAPLELSERCWGLLDRSWGLSDRSWRLSGRSWSVPGESRRRLWSALGVSRSTLGGLLGRPLELWERPGAPMATLGVARGGPKLRFPWFYLGFAQFPGFEASGLNSQAQPRARDPAPIFCIIYIYIYNIILYYIILLYI